MKIYITAKTDELCENIRAALGDLCTQAVFDGEPTDCEAIIISAPLKNEFGLDFAVKAGKISKAPIILLARADIADDIRRRIRFTGAFVLEKPFQKSVLVQTVKMAVEAKENFDRLQTENEELTRRLADIKIIDRAKCCLIQYLNLTEEQAHAHIQRLSMDTGRTARETADDILRTYLQN